MSNTIIWKTEQNLVPYCKAVEEMENYVNKMYADNIPEKIWLLEHPNIYTAGVSAKPEDLVEQKFPIVKTGRGGKYTYHGPKMRIIYAMINLKSRNLCDIRQYVYNLEQWVINSLRTIDIDAQRRKDRIGIWVKTGNNTEDKIAAIGVRVRKWITYHGISININPNLNNFSGIIPCGINNPNYGITSLHKLGITLSMSQFDKILKKEFFKIFK